MLKWNICIWTCAYFKTCNILELNNSTSSLILHTIWNVFLHNTVLVSQSMRNLEEKNAFRLYNISLLLKIFYKLTGFVIHDNMKLQRWRKHLLIISNNPNARVSLGLINGGAWNVFCIKYETLFPRQFLISRSAINCLSHLA